MLSSLFAHLPAVRTKYSSESQHLIRLIEELKKDIMVRGVTKDHWGLARKVGMIHALHFGLCRSPCASCNNMNITGKVLSLKKVRSCFPSQSARSNHRTSVHSIVDRVHEVVCGRTVVTILTNDGKDRRVVELYRNNSALDAVTSPLP